MQPAGRPDHAARLLLADMALWDDLSSEDQAMLCGLPPPHGALFIWLDSQFQEHGPLAWGALRDELPGREFEALALRVMAAHLEAAGDATAPADPNEARKELRALLNLMLIDQLKQLETEALAEAATNPEALARWRSLHERRRGLAVASS